MLRHYHKEVIEMAKKVEGYIKLQIPAGKATTGSTGCNQLLDSTV